MKKFSYLRKLLYQKDVDQAYLGELLKRSTVYISNCMTAKTPWKQDEQYKIMDIIGAKYEEMYLLFPKDGAGRDCFQDSLEIQKNKERSTHERFSIFRS